MFLMLFFISIYKFLETVIWKSCSRNENINCCESLYTEFSLLKLCNDKECRDLKWNYFVTLAIFSRRKKHLISFNWIELERINTGRPVMDWFEFERSLVPIPQNRSITCETGWAYFNWEDDTRKMKKLLWIKNFREGCRGQTIREFYGYLLIYLDLFT